MAPLFELVHQSQGCCATEALAHTAPGAEHLQILYRGLGFQQTGAAARLRPTSPVMITELNLGPG
jgi:hypothetical protein